MRSRTSGRLATRVGLLALLALVVGACIDIDADTTVGGDGAAATTIVFELDLGAIDDLLGGFAESFGEELGDEATADEEPEGLVEQFESELGGIEDQLDQLYDERPDLRDRFAIRAELTDDDVLVMTVEARTETIEELELLYADLLSSSEEGVADIYDLDEDLLAELGGGDADGETSTDFGFTSGVGDDSAIFDSIEFDMDDEFRFEATPVAMTDGADEELFDLGGFGLEPEITITITAPGDVVDTNGEADGRTVTWTLDGTDDEPLRLVSEVDPSASAGSIGGADDDDGNVLALAIAAGVLAALAVGVVVLLRNRRGPGSPTPATEVDTGAPDAPPSSPPVS